CSARILLPPPRRTGETWQNGRLTARLSFEGADPGTRLRETSNVKVRVTVHSEKGHLRGMDQPVDERSKCDFVMKIRLDGSSPSQVSGIHCDSTYSPGQPDCTPGATYGQRGD